LLLAHPESTWHLDELAEEIMVSQASEGIKDRSRTGRVLAISILVVLLAAFGVAGLASAKPLFVYDTTLWRVSDRIGIRTDTPDANTVLDATRSGADTYIKSRNSSLGAYFQTQSGVNWAGYNMLNNLGQTATYFGYRGSTQFRVFDGLAGQDRILMDAAGTANGNIYLNPSNSGKVAIGTMTPSATLHVATGTGDGIRGITTAGSGMWSGVYGESISTEGNGVIGRASATTGDAWGVGGLTSSDAGTGVWGRASATTGYTTGVYGESYSTDGTGVIGWGAASSGYNAGVVGGSDSSDGVGVWGTYPGGCCGWAGYFDGDTGVGGDLYVYGTLYKTAGGFRIDHPLDPDKYLNHSFVESPDMKNIYDGMVTLDENGEARIVLPDWFEALNGDFRYQLTPIGAAMPDLHVSQEIQDNEFQIAGGIAGMKVSWLITGIRHDPYAEAHRIPVEQDKAAGDRGASGSSPQFAPPGAVHRDTTSK
jgi:hypothetical protein